MFAILKSGGKQYKVKEGSLLKIEKVENNLGGVIEFNDILMIEDAGKTKFGNPLVSDVKITGKVVRQDRHKKIKIIKFRRRKHSMKCQGHRQYYTEVKIISIKIN